MAMDVKGKKTSLREDASIYEKRDEEESEKSKWARMNRQQRITHFKTYYLRPLIIGLVVLAIAGFFLYKDVIMRTDVVYQCAVVNENALDIPVEEFADGFTGSLGLDTARNRSSFRLYYTDGELAGQLGISPVTERTQLSSMIYANTLDSMIAGQKDFDGYREHKFFEDLTKLLSEEELRMLQDRLYIPDTPDNPDKHPYGIYLTGNEVYGQMFEGGGGIVEQPIFGVLFNSEHKEYSKQFLYYVFPELKRSDRE